MKLLNLLLILLALGIFYVTLKSQITEGSLLDPRSEFQPTPTHTPPPTPSKTKEALVSWYCEGFEGNRTASGEIYDCDALTAAHNSLPFGTRVRLTAGGNSVEVTINDRGGFQAYGREFDVTPAVFARLAPIRVGILAVEWEIL